MKHTLPLLLITAFASAQEPDTQPVDQNWLGFRGTDGQATSRHAVPREWNAKRNMLWKTALPGPGSSSPIVVGQSIFVTCWSGYGLDTEKPGEPKDLMRHLLRIELGTGKIEWTKDIATVKTEDAFAGRMSTHGYASSTPVSDGEHLYVFFGKAGVFAFDFDGEQLWQTNVGKGSSEWTTGSGSSPALWNDLLFVNASDESQSLRALNKKTGKQVWKRESKDFDQAYATPLVTPSGVLVFPFLGWIWGLDPESGKTLWDIETKTNGALAPSPVLGDGVVYSFGGQTKTKSFTITTAGKKVWSSRYGTYVTTPLLHDDHVYWVTEGGIAHCAYALDGELVYKQRLDGQFYASPVRAEDAIYYLSRNNGTFVLPAEPEFEVLAHNLIEGDDSVFDGTPVPCGGMLLLRSRQALYCVKSTQ